MNTPFFRILTEKEGGVRVPFFLHKKKKQPTFPVLTTLAEVLQAAKQSSDFVKQVEASKDGEPIHVYYYQSLIDMERIAPNVLHPLKQVDGISNKALQEALYSAEVEQLEDVVEIEKRLLKGSVLISFKEKGAWQNWLVDLAYMKGREMNVPEIEFSVFGSKESFIEAVETNLALLRKRIPSSDLHMVKFVVGSETKTDVYVIYCASIANKENVQTVKQRIKGLQIDQVPDSSTILQVIQDNNNSVFPQLVDTERPDRTAGALLEGKVAVLADGSPQALLAPVTALEFIVAFEDYLLSWHTASMLRIIRIGAVLFSIFATPLYVAVLSYHPEMIPQDLFATLVVSRTAVPFPPIIEALFLEVTIELLREAGARLPTKIGQTIGIVGGIVIGTAAVEAGLTSNVLLIIVALAALASFTIPVYRMGTTIRIVRFPFILAAQIWGLIGIAIMLIFTLCHLLSLTSLGRPYMEPIYPFSFKDMKDSIIRLPIAQQTMRPRFLQAKQQKRFLPKHNRQQKPDIDDGY
nr:spore germination protein [Shouchella clausii]